MQLDKRSINSLWASLMVEELVRSGVRAFCLAPGSRCTPLTLAVAEMADSREDVRVFQHTDERGLGYFAVGYARAWGQPAVVITTSGTAVANLLPAVVEASIDHLPMILLTADRPPELRDIGANQTIDQVKIFGDYVGWFSDLPCPTTEIEPGFVLNTMDHVVHMSALGPVHLNAQFREPLVPPDTATCSNPNTALDAYLGDLGVWQASELPFTRYDQRDVGYPVGAELVALAASVDAAERGVLIAGSGLTNSAADCLIKLGRHLRWPVLVDISNGAARGASFSCFYDVHLRDPAFADAIKPDLVLYFGGRLVSKACAQWLKRSAVPEVVIVHRHEARFDPELIATRRITADEGVFASALLAKVAAKECSEWHQLWAKADGALEPKLDAVDDFSEPSIARKLSTLLGEEHGLFLGNSMPVRDMDTFAARPFTVGRVAFNRGASGIDGTLSTAIGFAQGLQGPVTLLIGDLALIHDLNALSLLAQMENPVTIVVVNNDGGGIFSFLPISESPAFEKYFGTPHGLSFGDAAAWAGVAYHAPSDLATFEQAYKTAIASGGSSLIEVKTNREENRARHRELLT